MTDLWQTPNIRLLPTPSEIKLTKKSIDILEVQLQNAQAALQLAQQAVTALQRQIDEKKTWIAPIRRIPHDVISMIFLELCQTNWSAPMILSSVCRSWRESILVSPRAWSYFQLRDSQSPELQALFLSRSAPCHLHLRLPSRFGLHASRLLASVAERIQCLSMDITHISFLRDNRFPALEGLNLFDSRHNLFDSRHAVGLETDFILNPDLFPCLQLLDTDIFFEEIMRRKPSFSGFIPLQALSISSRNPHVWSMVVENCRESLTSLSVRLYTDGTPIFARTVILLPRLKYLSIQSYYTAPIPWVIDARTPTLQAYAEASTLQGFVGPTHEDTKTVISLTYSGDMDLSKFPQVRQIRVRASELYKMTGRLMAAPEICPNLETIVDNRLGGDQLIPAKGLIAARNRQTGGNIQFGRGRRDGVYSYIGLIPSNVRLSRFPRLIFSRSVGFQCGYGMPCAFR
jgi:hypothetical protein